jgi:hypothetical protein
MRQNPGRSVRDGEGAEGCHLLRVDISNRRSRREPEPARPACILAEPGIGYWLFTRDIRA